MLLFSRWVWLQPHDCSPPGPSVHGISQARILEWVTTAFTRGSSQPRDWTRVSCIGRWILYHLSHLGSKPWGGCVCVCVCFIVQSCLTLQLLDCNLPGSSVHGDSPDKNTGVGCHALLQGTFPTQGSNSDTLPSESPEGLDLTRRLNFSTVRVALYSAPCTICFSPPLQSDFPLLPPFFLSIHISHTFGSSSLSRSAHHWIYTVFHSFSKVRVFLNRFDVVYLTSDMFQLTITWFGFFLRCQLQTVKYTQPKYVGWKVLIETYTCITNTPIKIEHPIISERSLLSLQANHCISLEATTSLLSISVTWFYLLRNFIEMEVYVLFF